MNRSRVTGDLASHGNIFVDIANDRVGIGSTIPGQKLSLPDSAKIALGNSADLEIYHDGSHSYIHDGGTGNLKLRSNNFRLSNADESKISATFVPSGAAELYYDNSAKFKTKTYGVNVIGTLETDGLVISGVTTSTVGVSGGGSVVKINKSGTSELTSIYNNNAATLAINDSGAGAQIVLRGQSPKLIFDQTAGGNGSIYYDSTDFVIYRGVPVGAPAASEVVRFNSFGLNVTGTTDTDGLVVSGVSTFSGNVNVGSATITNPSGTALDFSGSITASDVVTAGALLHEGDTDTLVHFSAANTIELKTGGTSRLAVNNSGLSLQNNATFNINGGRLIFGDSTGGATDDRIVLGNDNDCFLYHDGSNSIIDNNTGDLIIRGDADDVKILAEDDIVLRDNDDSTNFIHCINGGAVELYHNGTKKFETTNSGVTVNGNLLASTDGNTSISLQDTGHGFSASSLSVSNGGRDLDITAPKDIRLKPTAGENGIVILDNGAVELYHNNVKKVETNTQGLLIPNTLGVSFGDVGCKVTGTAGSGASAGLFFMTNSGNKWQITGDGHLLPKTAVGGVDIGSASAEIGHIYMADSKKLHLGNSQDLIIFHSGANSHINHVGTGGLFIDSSGDTYFRNTAGDENRAIFKNNGAVELYHDGGQRLETTTGGVEITNASGIPNLTVKGTGSNRADVRILATGTGNANVYLDASNGDLSGADYAVLQHKNDLNLALVNYAEDIEMYVRSGTLGAGGLDKCFHAHADGAVELYHNGTKKFDTGSTVNVNYNHFEITSGQQLRFDNSNNNRTSEILNTGSSGTSQLSFKTNGAERFNITSTGRAIFISNNGLFIKPETDSNDAKISFSTNNNNSNNQIGHFKYNHQDDNVLSGYGEGFILGGTESNGCVLRVDGGINIIDSGSAGGNGAKLSLGTDQDMRIYHTGSDGFIEGTGVGGLRIRYDDIIISNKNSSGTRRFKINKDQGMDVFATTNGGLNGTDGVTIRMSDHSAEGQIGSITYKHSDNAFVNDSTNECFKIHGTENQTALLLDGRMYISDSKFVLKPTFSNFDDIPSGTNSGNSVGCMMKYHSEINGNSGVMSNSAKEPFIANRSGDDGIIMRIRHQGNTEGQITVSGNQVSYQNFMGAHKAQFVDHSKPDILVGTVLETVDQLATWKYASFSVGVGTAATTKYIPYYGSKNDGETDTITFDSNTYSATIKDHRDPMPEMTKHVCVKVSDTVGSKAVFGVFYRWEEDDVVERESSNAEYSWNDLDVAAIGNFYIRMQSGQTPEVGDYVESAGDGTAKVQSDDILRSKTIAKITSTTKQKTYDDGSFIVTCTMHCG